MNQITDEEKALIERTKQGLFLLRVLCNIDGDLVVSVLSGVTQR